MEVGHRRAVVGEVDADGDLAVDEGAGGDGDAALLGRDDDLAVPLVERGRVGAGPAAVAEADDVEADGREALEVLAGVDRGGERLGLAAVLEHRAAERGRAVLAPGEPHLEGAEAAGEVRPVVGEPGRAGGDAAVEAREVGRLGGEGRAVRRAVADQHAAGVVGDVRPLVEVEGDRVGALDPREARAELRAHHGERPEGPVDVEPQALALRDLRDRGEVVDGAGVDRARRADDQERRRRRRAGRRRWPAPGRRGRGGGRRRGVGGAGRRRPGRRSPWPWRRSRGPIGRRRP